MTFLSALPIPPAKVFPSILIVLDVAAAVVCGVTGGWAEWRKVLYWGAAGLLTYVVTW